MNKEYRLSALRVQRNVMRAELSEETLAEDERYQRIEQRIAELETELAERASA